MCINTVYIYIYVYIYIHRYIYVLAYAYTCMAPFHERDHYARMYIYIYICIYMYTCVCVCIYVLGLTRYLRFSPTLYTTFPVVQMQAPPTTNHITTTMHPPHGGFPGKSRTISPFSLFFSTRLRIRFGGWGDNRGWLCNGYVVLWLEG